MVYKKREREKKKPTKNCDCSSEGKMENVTYKVVKKKKKKQINFAVQESSTAFVERKGCGHEILY